MEVFRWPSTEIIEQAEGDHKERHKMMKAHRRERLNNPHVWNRALLWREGNESGEDISDVFKASSPGRSLDSVPMQREVGTNALVCLSCCNKMPQTEWLKHHIGFSPVLEDRGSRSRCWQI